MNRRSLKKKVLQLLSEGDFERVVGELAEEVPTNLINPLFSALCANSDIVRWNSIRCFGIIVPKIAEHSMESARVIMRRFLWSLNDESGGIGWGAPEALAEIMVNHDRLADEYLHMLISYTRGDGPQLFEDGNYLELPMLQRGLLWGIGRLCTVRKEVLNEKGVDADIHHYLQSEDKVVRGMAVWCLCQLGDRSAADMVRLTGDGNARVPIFLDGDIKEFSLSQLVEQYENMVNSSDCPVG